MSKREKTVWVWVAVLWCLLTIGLFGKLFEATPVRVHSVPSWVCDKDYEQGLRRIYLNTRTDGMEWGFSAEKPVIVHTDHQLYGVTVRFTRGISQAIVHTHVSTSLQKPSDVDRKAAKDLNIPVVVLGIDDRTIWAAMPDGTIEQWSRWNGVPTACEDKYGR